jgi:hypothetical protein
MSTVTIAASELHALLAATIPFASRDDTLPTICAVRIEAGNGVATATATDRYSLGHARKKADGELPPVLLPVGQAERLATEVKGRQGEQLVELRFAPSHLGDAITVHLGDMDWRITQAPGADHYPDLTPILDPSGYESVGIDGVVRLAPRLLARVYDAVGALDSEPARLYFRGDDKPLRAEVGDWFAALLMPVRHRQYSDEHEAPAPIVPYALPDAPATLPEPGPALSVRDFTYPKTVREATAGRMARYMAAAVHKAATRVYDQPWPALPPPDQRTDEHRGLARAHADMRANVVHTYGVAHLLRAFAAAAPTAADKAARDLWLAWDDGDGLDEWAYQWLVEYGVDPVHPLPRHGWPGALRTAEELTSDD